MLRHSPPFGPRLALCCFAALVFGLAGSAWTSSRLATRQPFLFDLHLHGSLSEGSATMGHHGSEAERLGFDGLWWADHMGRQTSYKYIHTLGFEDSLSESHGASHASELVLEPAWPGSLSHEFLHDDPVKGIAYLRVDAESHSGSVWETNHLDYEASGKSVSKSMLAAPVVLVWARVAASSGDAAFLVRVRLSSRPDGATEFGTPNVLEYLPQGMNAPPPPARTVRVPLPPLPPGVWTRVALPLAQDAMLFPEGVDQSLSKIQFLIQARDEGKFQIDLDDFKIVLTGPTDLELFRAQERFLAERGSPALVQHVGMEVGGPQEQPIEQVSTHDHLLAFYPKGIPALIDYRDPASLPDDYPGSSVAIIQEQGGVAIVAHLFGSSATSTPKSQAVADFLAGRVLRNRAWGADGIEIGYPFRERPLADFVTVWDALSRNGIWITGIGATDNHHVQPWDQRQNRWASWLRAADASAPALCQAVREGQVFFGDPLRFDPNGDVMLEEAGRAYSMGDVVPIAPSNQHLHVHVDGGRAGDDVVLVANGVPQGRRTFTGPSLDRTFTVWAKPGTFVRLELRDPSDQIYLMSNPIYFVDLATTPPPDRAPKF